MGEGGVKFMLHIAIIIKQLIGSLTASDMPTLTKAACFCSLKGKIDFENLLLLEKMLENLPLEQDIFPCTYFQLDWGVAIIRGV